MVFLLCILYIPFIVLVSEVLRLSFCCYPNCFTKPQHPHRYVVLPKTRLPSAACRKNEVSLFLQLHHMSLEYRLSIVDGAFFLSLQWKQGISLVSVDLPSRPIVVIFDLIIFDPPQNMHVGGVVIVGARRCAVRIARLCA
jgi:hypothetical protein